MPDPASGLSKEEAAELSAEFGRYVAESKLGRQTHLLTPERYATRKLFEGLDALQMALVKDEVRRLALEHIRGAPVPAR